MRLFIITVALIIGFTSTIFTGAVFSETKTPEGKALAELAFDSASNSERGFLDMGEMENFRSSIFTSVDSNDDNYLDLNEFMDWDMGFINIAEDTNKVRAYNTAKKIIFAIWDRNGNGKISVSEHRKSTISDFQRADDNNDAVLTKDEFLQGLLINIAIRAALKD